ncbi:DNA ligase D [Thiohalomonas denitrificans]|uniref:DNA ligase (ATP) n=1 Tax=Thiohalomonas denitrificans TaxID=415747 RepID=A0A1G5Q8E7_9GAMM|nr:DNA ligase D [Thiohalomonas denitrificans]SCZ58134.1 bifunctional non-homologous end joining protein LigD [Thiohalomonas denitrificans]
MALEKYRHKRNFERTPEPGGEEAASAGEAPLFVVQKHAARRLHYDFRLQVGVVMKSWAVPKGPSPNPDDRRLAVETEDHPLDYGDFEGVIPEGEYGAGAVMLWDRGRWQPEGDAETAWRRGHLSFRLEGEKLRGRWSLVRTGGKESRNWLLIKSDDDEAGSHWSKAEENRSVVSGRSLEQIAESRDHLWHSESGGEALLPEIEGRPEPLPATMEAQLARLTDTPPEGEQWLHEIKFDGYRILARLDAGKVRLISRNGKDWTDKFGPIARALADLPIQNAWLDGEICTLLPDGRTSFQGLQEALSRGHEEELVYFVFDLLYLDGLDLRDRALEKRKLDLNRLLDRVGSGASPLRYADHITGHGTIFHEQACSHGLEGTLAKRVDAPYRGGRGGNWRKIKCLLRQEFVVGGYTDPAGGRKGLGALLLGVYENGALRYVGRVGTGFTEAILQDLHERLRPLEQADPPFTTGLPRSSRSVHWVRPELIAEVQFAEWTREGILRTPSYQGLREDKPPTEVRREATERLTPSSTASAREEAPPRLLNDRIDGLKLSSPDKVLYPEQGLTKRDLAHYYQAVSDRILPWLAGRPLTLLRCPEGHHKECFFQKHAEGTIPKAIRRVMIPEKTGKEAYLFVDDLEGLIGLVQMGVLEIHTWGARTDRTEAPDRVIFDLDPDAGLDWGAVVDAALAVRSRLRELGLESFLTTTGGKGLHVVMPLMRRHGWKEVKAFAKAVAEDLVNDAPRRYTASPSKRARQGKLFIDYLRNSRGATAITPYGTRARAGAPVATPIAWDELTLDLRADQWNVHNISERLTNLEEDPWKTYRSVHQSITVAVRRQLGLE